MAKKKRTGQNAGILTEQELRFVTAYKGNAAAAARDIGIHQKNASKLMVRPRVNQAISEKQGLIIRQTARDEYSAFHKVGMTDEALCNLLWKIANTPPEFTGNSYASQIRACEVLGRWRGMDIKVNGDEAMELFLSRSVEDNLYFAAHGWFPEDERNPAKKADAESPAKDEDESESPTLKLIGRSS